MKINRRLLIEILSAHADQLNRDRHAMSSYLAGFPEHRETLEPLLTTAQRAKDTLAPAKPSHTFRRDLRRSLDSAASNNRVVYPRVKTERRLLRSLLRILVSQYGRARTRVLVAATAGSAISLLSLIALFLRSRASQGSEAIGLI